MIFYLLILLLFLGLITLLVPIFVQKCQIGHLVFLSFNLVSIFKKLMKFCPFR